MGSESSSCCNKDSDLLSMSKSSFMKFNLEVFDNLLLINELSYKDYKKFLKKIQRKNEINLLIYEKIKEYFLNSKNQFNKIHYELFPMYEKLSVKEDLFIFMLPFYHDKNKFSIILDHMNISSLICNLSNFLELVEQIYENFIFYELSKIKDVIEREKSFGKFEVSEELIIEYGIKTETYKNKKEFLKRSYIDEIKDYIYKVSMRINSNKAQFSITDKDDFNGMIDDNICYCLDNEYENYLGYHNIMAKTEIFIKLDNSSINGNQNDNEI